MLYIVLIKTSNGIAVLTDNDGVISAENHSHKWVNFYEDMYDRSHGRSYEGSMSACINYIMMQPSIVAVKNVKDISKRIVDMNSAKLSSFSSVSGNFTGITSDKNLDKIWDKGIHPRLIKTV